MGKALNSGFRKRVAIFFENHQLPMMRFINYFSIINHRISDIKVADVGLLLLGYSSKSVLVSWK